MALGILFTAFSISFYLLNIITWHAAVLASYETPQLTQNTNPCTLSYI